MFTGAKQRALNGTLAASRELLDRRGGATWLLEFRNKAFKTMNIVVLWFTG
jgi:hypothetical protein